MIRVERQTNYVFPSALQCELSLDTQIVNDYEVDRLKAWLLEAREIRKAQAQMGAHICTETGRDYSPVEARLDITLFVEGGNYERYLPEDGRCIL